MRSRSLLRLVALVACATLAACGDSRYSGPTTNPDAAVASQALPPNVASTAVCTPTSIQGLIALADSAFGSGSPNAQSVIGKLGQLNALVLAPDAAGARSQAINTIEFTIRKNTQSPLPGGQARVVAFINAVACFGGLDFSITTLGSFYFIQPSDGPQVLKSVDGWAGISLPANPVFEPTLLHIERIPFVAPRPGAGPLSTKLDQYDGFYDFDIASVTNGKLLAKPAIVGICAPPATLALIFNRLRLGHNRSAGFAIEPSAEANFITCGDAFTIADATRERQGLFGHVAALFTPQVAFAATTSSTMFYGGGVGGTVIELSPFALVDPLVSMSGGVGGTVIELQIRALENAVAACLATEAPIGTSLEVGCRPKVEVKTFLGTALEEVPITFTVTAGGGVVARQAADNACVTPFSASSVVVPTDTSGVAGACWTLGMTPGQNKLRATAAVGGQAPPGVTFSNSVEFVATANAPRAVVLTSAPAAGAQIVAGTNIPVVATVVDRNGVTVAGFNELVTLTLNQNSFAAGGTVLSTTAVAGVATFTTVAINAAAGGYAVTAAATYGSLPFSAIGDVFSITPVPGVGSVLSIASPNPQTALAGSTLASNPTVLLKDRFGNVLPGETIVWTAGGSSEGSVAPGTSVTAAAGTAFTVWTIGSGTNELRASYGTISSVLLTAVGTTPTLSVLNQCLPGNNGDVFSNNLSESPNAFWIPDPGVGRTIREITLYISSAGQASAPTSYNLTLRAQRGTFDEAVSPPVVDTATVFLRGSNSETKPVTFVLNTPIVGSANRDARAVMLDIRALTNPDGVRLNFNTGTCSPGSKCSVPPICKVTQVSSPTPFPAGTTYRRSVAIMVKGN